MKKLLTIILLLSGVVLYGQQLVSYNMMVPQRDYYNPSNVLNCNSIQLPALYTGFTSSAFKYNNLFSQDANGNYYVDFQKLYDHLRDKNYFALDLNLDLFGLGFWVGDYYITFNQRLKTSANIVYPKGMFKLLAEGNYDGNENTISFDGFGPNFIAYNETSIGVATEVLPGLTVGAKLKFLKGIANLNTDNFSYSLTVDDSDTLNYPITFKGSYSLQMSNGLVQLVPTYDEDGLLSGIELQNPDGSDFNSSLDATAIKNALWTKSSGIGLDLGATYQPMDKLNVWASITDLGFIRWRSNPLTLRTNDTSFTFYGVDIINSDSSSQALMNNLIKMSNPVVDPTAYTTWLSANLNFGGYYQVMDWLTVGAMYQGKFFKGSLYSYFSVNTNVNVWRGTSIALGYTSSPGRASNLGLGMSMKLGVFQWYFIADNMAPAFFGLGAVTSSDATKETFGTKLIKNSQMLKFQFGFNFIFGCKDRRDFPLLTE